MSRNETKITILGDRNKAKEHLKEAIRVIDEFESEERPEGVEGMVYIEPFRAYTLKGKLYLVNKS